MVRHILVHSFDKMMPNTQRIGHDRECRIDSAAGYETAAIDNVEIVQVVGFAIYIEHAGSRISAETDGAHLMMQKALRDSCHHARCICFAAASIPST